MRKRAVVLDTDPESERVLIAIARTTPDWKKFEQVATMTAACRRLSMIGLKDRYPQATEGELLRRLAALVLDRETVIQVYGWDPEVEGY